MKSGSSQLSGTKQTGLRTWGAGDFHFSTVWRSCFKFEINHSSGDWAWRAMSVKTLPCQTVLKSRSGTVHPALGLSLENTWFNMQVSTLIKSPMICLIRFCFVSSVVFHIFVYSFFITSVKLNKDFSRCAVSSLRAPRCLEMRKVLCWQGCWNEP